MSLHGTVASNASVEKMSPTAAAIGTPTATSARAIARLKLKFRPVPSSATCNDSNFWPGRPRNRAHHMAE